MRNKYKGDDIRARLHHTIIRHKGTPFIAEVDSTGTIGLVDLVKGELIRRVEPDDADLDISSIPLGYVNFAGRKKLAVYLKREPLRRFKQGVEISYLTQKTLGEEGSINFGSLQQCQGLVDCVMNKYPTVVSAQEMLIKGGWASAAVSRNVALKRVGANYSIFVKEEEVGTMRVGSTTINIPKSELSFIYKDVIEEVPGWTVVEV